MVPHRRCWHRPVADHPCLVKDVWASSHSRVCCYSLRCIIPSWRNRLLSQSLHSHTGRRPVMTGHRPLASVDAGDSHSMQHRCAVKCKLGHPLCPIPLAKSSAPLADAGRPSSRPPRARSWSLWPPEPLAAPRHPHLQRCRCGGVPRAQARARLPLLPRAPASNPGPSAARAGGGRALPLQQVITGGTLSAEARSFKTLARGAQRAAASVRVAPAPLQTGCGDAARRTRLDGG